MPSKSDPLVYAPYFHCCGLSSVWIPVQIPRAVGIILLETFLQPLFCSRITGCFRWLRLWFRTDYHCFWGLSLQDVRLGNEAHRKKAPDWYMHREEGFLRTASNDFRSESLAGRSLM